MANIRRKQLVTFTGKAAGAAEIQAQVVARGMLSR
jgi:hypothetical protein